MTGAFRRAQGVEVLGVVPRVTKGDPAPPPSPVCNPRRGPRAPLTGGHGVVCALCAVGRERRVLEQGEEGGNVSRPPVRT